MLIPGEILLHYVALLMSNVNLKLETLVSKECKNDTSLSVLMIALAFCSR